MKKILIGLLALSATAMATSTGITTGTGDNSIDISTKAFIINSGLIITESPNEITAIKSVELDHGTLMIGRNEDSSVDRNVYIRKSTGSNLPAGAVLEIALTSTGNNLVNGSSSIPHTLTAQIDTNATSTALNNSLVVAGDTIKSKTEFTVVGSDVNAVGINLKSEIAQGNLATDKNLVEGAYSNTSTLSVKLSKVPTVTGTPVTPPAQESGR
ncbi:hypothetical protein [Cetobacterium sp.]|uniref:hypothetical protein n=1 Tax=Cetobacterium sp. TaxID=2071632 RepID=UPI003F388D06